MLVLRGVLCVAVMTWLFAGLSAEAGMQKKLAPLAPRSVTLGADYSQLKIAPPATGLYLGQYEWQPGDIATMEAAAGMHTTHYAANRGHWSIGYDGAGNPHLDLAQANAAWDAGRAIVVQAFNTYAGADAEHPVGFTVDKLLRGQYDAALHTFALELKAFGKPVFFQIGREPNGVGGDYFGGFGLNGDKSLAWAIANNAALNKFTPPARPAGAPANLYTGVASNTVCDGAERLKAAQRYYHDFFERRENLHFLTWDTMGWAVLQVDQTLWDSQDYPAAQQTYAKQVLDSCQDFKNMYPGDAYVDWVSINWYMLDYYMSDWPGFTQDYILSIDSWFQALNKTMAQVLTVAATKPVMFTELGFPDGRNPDSAYAALKVQYGLQGVLDYYPQIKAVSFWANHPSWMVPGVFPYDCLIRPNTQQGQALHAVIVTNPGKFKSCISLTDGSRQPNCVE